MSLRSRIANTAGAAIRAWRGGSRWGGIVRYHGPSVDGVGGFLYGAAPRALRENLMWSEVGVNIRWHARRAARGNEYCRRFLQRAGETAFWRDFVELPFFPGVPGELAAYVARAWSEWWETAVDSRGRTLHSAEVLHHRDWLIDGEIFFDWEADGRIRAIPSDLITDYQIAENDYRVEKWLTQGKQSIDSSDLLHVAILESNWQLRGRSWLGPALPELFPDMEFRDNAATGIRDLSKLAAVQTNEGPGDGRRLPPIGAGGYDAMGSGSASDGSLQSARDRFRAAVPGWIEDLKAGQKLVAPDYGPPSNAQAHVGGRAAVIAIALQLSETELTGDHTRHNFASLQVAEARDMKTYVGLRQRWYTLFRRPLFLWWLDQAIAFGTVPVEAVEYYRLLSRPRWQGPRLVSAQPLKDAQALEKMAALGQVNLRRIAASQGENAARNAEENAAIMAGAPAAPAASGELSEAALEQIQAIVLDGIAAAN